MHIGKKKIALVVGIGAMAMSAFAGYQFGINQVLKIGGVALAVKTFGKDMNKGINKLSNHTDSNLITTKVVPIFSIGISTGSAIGAAQVMGPRKLVDQVVGVGQPQADLFGHEVRLKALIPVSSKNFSDIKRVDGVGVSGIVDIKL